MMSDVRTISPHVLTHPDGRVLCLPTDERHERKAMAEFVSRKFAEEMSPDSFHPVFAGPEELETLAAHLGVWTVIILGLGGELEGSVLPLDVFVGILSGELG